MVVNTTRFGQVDLKEDDILTFPEGLLGFADLRKFVLLDDPSDEIFAWLQSCDAGAIAFPVLEPDIFTENFSVNLSKGDLETLKLKDAAKAHFFSIITISELHIYVEKIHVGSQPAHMLFRIISIFCLIEPFDSIEEAFTRIPSRCFL